MALSDYSDPSRPGFQYAGGPEDIALLAALALATYAFKGPVRLLAGVGTVFVAVHTVSGWSAMRDRRARGEITP